MRNVRKNSGFTLAEVAIVVTIVGLLLAGALKGLTLTQNARVVAEVSQVQAINNASHNFLTVFSALPGDMATAGTRIPGCPGAAGIDCNPLAGTPGAGDGIIGSPTWAAPLGAAWPAPGYGVTTPGIAPNNVDDERYLFWDHLQLASMISIGGVSPGSLTTATKYGFGVTHPLNRMSGGFQVGYDNGIVTTGNTVMPAGSGISGMILLQETSAELTGPLSLVAGGNALTPFQAWQVDVKMDDGRPGTGYVQAFGVTNSCFNTAAPYSAASPGYLQTVITTDCGLMFRLKN